MGSDFTLGERVHVYRGGVLVAAISLLAGVALILSGPLMLAGGGVLAGTSVPWIFCLIGLPGGAYIALRAYEMFLTRLELYERGARVQRLEGARAFSYRDVAAVTVRRSEYRVKGIPYDTTRGITISLTDGTSLWVPLGGPDGDAAAEELTRAAGCGFAARPAHSAPGTAARPAVCSICGAQLRGSETKAGLCSRCRARSS